MVKNCLGYRRPTGQYKNRLLHTQRTLCAEVPTGTFRKRTKMEETGDWGWKEGRPLWSHGESVTWDMVTVTRVGVIYTRWSFSDPGISLLCTCCGTDIYINDTWHNFFAVFTFYNWLHDFLLWYCITFYLKPILAYSYSKISMNTSCIKDYLYLQCNFTFFWNVLTIACT